MHATPILCCRIVPESFELGVTKILSPHISRDRIARNRWGSIMRERYGSNLGSSDEMCRSQTRYQCHRHNCSDHLLFLDANGDHLRLSACKKPSHDTNEAFEERSSPRSGPHSSGLVTPFQHKSSHGFDFEISHHLIEKYRRR